MIKNYIKIAYRNLLRYKGHTLINVLGLSIGLAGCILILVFIQDELSYDRFHEKSADIYRIVTGYSRQGNLNYYPNTPAPLAPALSNECPEIRKITRFGSGWGHVITYGEAQNRNTVFALADPSVFDIFNIKLLQGNPQSALNNRSSVVISENMTRKFFGDKEPIGQILQIGGEDYHQDYQVTGVFRNLPSNSSLKFDCLASFQNNYITGNEGNLTWQAFNYTTFILLPKGCAPHRLESKIGEVIQRNNTEGAAVGEFQVHLQSLRKMHLDLDPGNLLPTDRDSSHIYIFTGITLLILLVACINFMNLAIARSSTRAKEVGLRKMIGAKRSQLVQQFLGESILLSFIAFLLSIPIVEILLPKFNYYAGKELSLIHSGNWVFQLSLFCLALLVGVMAGSYPALFLSSLKPIAVMKGHVISSKNNSQGLLRIILIVAQFTISILFVACTLVMHNQLSYIQSKNLGYNKDHLIIIPIDNQHVKSKYAIYKTEILRNAAILNATATSFAPSMQGYFQNVKIQGAREGSLNSMNWISVDYDFLKTLKIDIIRGRNFSPDFSTDETAYILNESAIKSIGWRNPLGERINIAALGPVIGVIKDFNFQSLHERIQPLALCIYPDLFQYLLVRVKPENITQSIPFLQNRWQEIFPDQPFEYGFFDQDFDRLYKTEIGLGNIFNCIALLALLVACLGLLGLVSFSTNRRTKEIGVRKTFGASMSGILFLLLKNITKWIFVAALIACPVAWYVMHKWLQNFAYRIDLTVWPFLFAGVLALVMALLTVSLQAIRAAKENPVEALRYE
jgi:putative ABC transport system permease protein